MRLQNSATRAVRKTRTAFTLLEILIVVSIIVVLAGTGYYYFVSRGQEAKEDLTKAKIDGLVSACEQFSIKHNRYPASLDELFVPVQIETSVTGEVTQPFLKNRKAALDAWNKPLNYNWQPGMATPEIWCESPNGKRISNLNQD